MDMSGISSMLGSLQSSLSIAVLQKAMGQDAQAVAAVLEDMAPQAQQLAPKAGSMDILV